MTKIINLNGILIDLQRVKAIFHNDYEDCNKLRIILNNRKDYVWNPNNENWELEEISDDFYIEFPNNDIAVENYKEMKRLWEINVEE